MVVTISVLGCPFAEAEFWRTVESNDSRVKLPSFEQAAIKIKLNKRKVFLMVVFIMLMLLNCKALLTLYHTNILRKLS